MTEEKDTKKPIKLASKIGIDDLMPLINDAKSTTDLYEKNKTLYEIIRKIPSDFLVLKDAVKEIICNEKDKIINKTEFNAIWKKTHPKKKTPTKTKKKMSEGKFKEDIKYDESNIRITNTGVFFVQPTWKGDAIEEKISEILDGDLEILYKTLDNDRQELFTYKYNTKIIHTQHLSNVLNELNTKIYKGQLGQDIIKKIFNTKSKELDVKKYKNIIGFNDGWIMPQSEEEKNFAIAVVTDYQKEAYQGAMKMIKNYTKIEKEEILKKLKTFIERTQINKNKLAIIIGWAMAAPFRMAFIELLNVFPLLILIGARSTGKSYINEFWSVRFYKIYKSVVSPDRFSSPSRLGDSLSSSTFPMNIQEVTSAYKNVIPVLKQHCTGSSDFERKYKDGIHKHSRPQTAPVCIDCNDPIKEFTDPAFNTKVINLEFFKEERIKRDPEWIDLFRSLKKEKLFSFVYKRTKNWKNANILKEIKKIEDEYKKDIMFIDVYHPRLSQIFLIVIFGIKLFEKIFDIKLKKDEIIDVLVGARRNLTTDLLQQFFLFCMRAKYVDEEKYSSIKYKLMLSKARDYYFTQDNLSDFNEYIRKFGSKPYRLKPLGELLQDGLPEEDKNMVKYTIGEVDGKSIGIIRIKNEFLPERKTIEEETGEELDADISIPGIISEELEKD